MDWRSPIPEAIGAAATAALAWVGRRKAASLWRSGWGSLISLASAPYERDLLRRQVAMLEERMAWLERQVTRLEADLRAGGGSGRRSGNGSSAARGSTRRKTPARRPSSSGRSG